MIKKLCLSLSLIGSLSILGVREGIKKTEFDIPEEIEKAIRAADDAKLQQVFEERKKRRTMPYDVDAGNIADYLTIANSIADTTSQEAKTLNNASAKKKISIGVSLIIAALYQLAGNILQQYGTSQSIQGVVISSSSLGVVTTGCLGVYELYLGLINKDAKDIAANAKAAKQTIQEYLSTQPASTGADAKSETTNTAKSAAPNIDSTKSADVVINMPDDKDAHHLRVPKEDEEI